MEMQKGFSAFLRENLCTAIAQFGRRLRTCWAGAQPLLGLDTAKYAKHAEKNWKGFPSIELTLIHLTFIPLTSAPVPAAMPALSVSEAAGLSGLVQ